MTTNINELIQDTRKTRKEARERFASERAHRIAESLSPRNTLLTPSDITGDYLVSRGLMTTLGGQRREITSDDLRRFAENVKELKKKYRVVGGIKPKTIIDNSTTIDRQRAISQINSALPTHYETGKKGGRQSLVIHFSTNASKLFGASKHSVNVEFMEFFTQLSQPEEPAKLVKRMVNSAVKFECDCGRHRYWYRYIATVGGFNFGREEPAFPKIRNPDLKGIACKHALRVMTTVSQSPSFKSYMLKLIGKFRGDLEHASQAEKIADQKAIAEQLKKESGRQKAIKTTEEKRLARAGWKKPEKAAEASARKKAAQQAELDAKGKSTSQIIRETTSKLKELQRASGNDAELLAALEAAMAAVKSRMGQP